MPKLPGRADTRPRVPLWLPLISWFGPMLYEDHQCVIDGCGRLIKHLDYCARLELEGPDGRLIETPAALYACGRCRNLIELTYSPDASDLHCLTQQPGQPDDPIFACRIGLDKAGGHPGDHWNGEERWPNGDPANAKPPPPPIEDETRMMGQNRER